MENPNILLTAGLASDFDDYEVKDEAVKEIIEKVMILAKRNRLGENVKGAGKIRKLRFGNFRLFILIEKNSVFMLGYGHRKNCYSKEFLSSLSKRMKD